MAAEIVHVEKVHLPPLVLIGCRYGDEDRVGGGFGVHWMEWFEKDRFAALEALPAAPAHEGAYLGALRMHAGRFEYWIGMAFPDGTAVPDGFDAVGFPESDAAVCWLKGREETGELFGDAAEAMTSARIRAEGWTSADAWSIERYACPRFTQPAPDGTRILDYVTYLRSGPVAKP